MFARLRNDFPILDTRVGESPLSYLDSGATSQKPQCVIDTFTEYYSQRNAAVHRGAHSLAVMATDAFEAGREAVANLVGGTPEQVCWTKNATEALNVVALGIDRASHGFGGESAQRFNLGSGDSIVVTEMEHHANLVPWQQLAHSTGATLRWIPVTDSGELDLSDLDTIVDETTKVFAFTHVSNVLGTINPVDTLVARAREVGALVVLDACQSVPHMPVNFVDLDVDFAAFSAHKALGPTGLGTLWGKSELLNALPPVLTGGSMITTVTMEDSEFMDAPQRFEAGTQPVAEVAAFTTAVNYLAEVGLDKIFDHERDLTRVLLDGIAEIPGITVLGSAEDRIGTVAFDVDGVHAHDVGQYLDSQGVAVRVGHHCAQPLHRRFGVTATTRASTYLYNNTEDCERFLTALAEVRPFFGVQ
ncbi:MAG: SufS family cysteine desulfurase [Brevibacterium aurantiacum]|uniref:Cysteine desulfurase n=2 Tax=Brevibacterium TaxID=1696 RepID=A0A2A3Z6I1_BREAU|nr:MULTISPECIES: SufS family cysteine desulfurase [Brevibacterium]MDN5549989.1 SufS family cysteine desulfurase [Brevibacterium sp.]AZL05953.1 SufS family cysteine desulfurase [Brevibacterium aurantiacum]AZL09515.1 SufS family cysteine desulfurase [Brevibacterium aurantiacum]AZT93643.1 SufS family cysteine desulfurase [Brevibacterium aurantiacum]MDN5594656.1 SufS family cysteine desulfurase [Brevibacterium sp.]